nr:hypothetical protein [Tanacetum cinerariifolium]
MIVIGTENHPAMLDKPMYDSWQSRMLLYIKGKKNRRTLLESMENAPLVYQTIEENGLLVDVYSLVNHDKAAKDIWGRVNLLMKGTELSFQEREWGNNVAGQARMVKGYNCHGEGHMTRHKRPRNSAWFKEKILLVQAHEDCQTNDLNAYDSDCDDISYDKAVLMANLSSYDSDILFEVEFPHTESGLVVPVFLPDLGIPNGQAIQTTIPHNDAFQTNDLNAYDSDCDDISYDKAVLMANLSSYDSDILFEVPQHDTYQNDAMLNQGVQDTHYFEQSLVNYVPDNEITSDGNIISYEQYLQEMQNAIVQDTNSFAQQDAMIMFVIEQMSNQVTNCNRSDL